MNLLEWTKDNEKNITQKDHINSLGYIRIEKINLQFHEL